jgi:hypothetical protein
LSKNIEAYAELLTPRGEIVAIDEPPEEGLSAAEGEEHHLALGVDVHAASLPAV